MKFTVVTYKIYEQTSSDFSHFVSVSSNLFVISSRPLPYMSLYVWCLFILSVLPSSVIRFVLASIKHRIVKYPHCTPITPSRGTKLWKDAATVRAIGVPNIAQR